MGRRLLLFFLSILFSFATRAQKIVPSGSVSLCKGEIVELKVIDADVGVAFQWLKGGDTIKSATSSIYSTNLPGKYSVIISKRSDNRKDTTLGPTEVIVHEIPTASFTFNVPSEQCRNAPVTFTATTTNDKTYLWNFGDPNSGNKNTSTLKNPSHTFIGERGQKSNKFLVTLTVTGEGGCSKTISQEITVNIKTDAALNGSGSKKYNNESYFTVCAKGSEAEFSFTNNSSTNSTNVNYRIIWGDNTPDFNSPTFNGVINHTYTVGAKTLLFIVTGSNGCIDTATYRVFLGTNPAVGFSNPGNTSICTESSLTFPILDVENNSPETKYTVSINDGSAPVTFDHPPPANYTHKFLLPSCGTISGNYPNSFSAKIVATNPCLTSEAVVTPIYVSGKPKAAMKLSSTSVCVNKIVNIVNTSLSAPNVTTSGVCTNAKVVWKILSPSGWKINSGTLGNDNGSLNPDLWVPGSQSLDIIFTATGKYKIVVLSGNINCGVSSDTSEICVNPIPVPNFTLDKNSGCGPLEVTATSSVNASECGSYKYKWYVNYSPATGCSPSTSQYEYVGSTDESINPKFKFINPGVYTIGLIVSTADGGCYSQWVYKTVTVKSKPVVEISQLASTICENGSISPKATINCFIDANTNYLWTFDGGTPANSSSADPGKVVYKNEGTFNILLSVENECGISTKNASIKVSPTPTITMPPDLILCSGTKSGAINFPVTPASTVSWTASKDIGFGTSQNGSIPAFTPINNTGVPITSIITVTAKATNGGCLKSETFKITVNPTPNPPAVSNISYCQNSVASPLSATAIADHTLLWYSTAQGGAALSQAPTPSTSTLGQTKYYVSQKSNQTQCESNRAEIIVTVAEIPSIQNAKGNNPTKCGSNNGSIELSGLKANTLYKVFFNGTSRSISSNNSGILVITDLGAGTYNNISVSLGNCNSSDVGPITLSDPNPPSKPAITATSPICSGQNIELKTNGISGAIYNWSGPGGFKSQNQNPIITKASTNASGTYTLTVTLNGCSSEGATVDVVVNETPEVSIQNNGPICTGQSLQFTSSTLFQSPLTYSWSGPAGFTSSEKNPILTDAMVSNSGVYKLSVTSSDNCKSEEVTSFAEINMTPIISAAIENNPDKCGANSGSISFTVNIPSSSFLVSYLKNGVSVQTTLASDANGKITIANLSAGNYDQIYVEHLGCRSNSLTSFTLSDPNPPAAPTAGSNSAVCSGNTLKLTASSIPNASFKWSGPNFSSNEQNPIIPNVSKQSEGTYSVSATVNNCTSPAGIVKVIINETPSATITSNSPICSGNDLQLNSQTNYAGNLNYEWVGPDNFNSASKNPSILSAQQKNSGTYTLTVTTEEKCSFQVSENVVVNQTPTISADFINPVNCGKPDGSIVLHGLSKNITYAVNYKKDQASSTTINLESNGNGDIIIANLGQGVYSEIFVTLKNCKSNVVSGVLKDPSSPLIYSVDNNGPLCSGSTLILSAKTDAGVSFSWVGPNQFKSTDASPVKANLTSADEGKYVLTITKNNCTASGFTEVIINALPSPPVAANVEYCINTSSQPLSATPAVGSSIVWYSTATGGSGSSIAPTPSTASAGITSFYVSQIDANGCESPRAEIKVTIHPDAIAEFTPTKILDCPPFIISSNVIGLKTYRQHNKFYEWYVDDNYIGEGIQFPGYTISNEDDTVKITLKTTSLYGCKNAETSHIFSTYKLPKPAFDISIDEGCAPLKVNFTNNTPNKNFFNYKWDFGNGITSTESDPGEMVYAPNPESGDTTYIVKLKTWNNCDTIELEKTITVKSKPITTFTPSKTEGCSPMKVTFTNNTKGKNVTYDWDFGDGTTLSTTSNEEVMHTFNAGVPTTFTVRLTATNECGSDIKEFKIVVSPNPIKLKFAMNGPDHFGCAPHSIVIYNNSIGASSYFWDFGDGNFLSTTKGVDSIKHTYLIPGDFTITVKASNNCTDTTTTDFVKVYPKPKASFTADRYVVCIGNEVAFQNQSELGTSYLWDFGDGNNSTLSDPKHIYTKSGLYTVKLLVTRLNGPGSSCTETVEQKIQVKDSLPGSFTASTLTAECAPFTVNFKNNNQPSVTAHWDFGDGTTGEGDQIDHTYLLSGSYNVTLIVTVPGGCTYTSTQTITIKGPSGTMTYDAGYICDGTVRLAANATGTDLYYWDFGDGKTETTSVPVVYHAYSLPGNYLPVLTLKNNAGCNFLIKGVDTVKIEKIEAGFSTSETKTCGNTSVNFKDTSHVYFGNTLVEWDFGDGQKGSGFEVGHNYIATGTYTIAQTITSVSGCTQTIKKDIFIHVNKNPSLVITAKNTGCNNESMQFDLEILSEDAINTVEWKISNGVSGNGKSFSYKFLTPGTYTISWLAGTVNGCFGTATHTITVYPAPTINASADQTICLGNSVQLKVSGTDTYQWSPIEGLSCTTCDNPVANPTKSTPYVASGFNSYGCVDRDTVYITVIPPLKLTSSGNDSICIGQSTKLLVSGAASYWWTPNEGLSSTSISNPVANPTITTKYRVVGYDGHGCFSDTAYLVVGVGAYPTIDLGPDQTLSTGTMLPLKSTITDGPIKDWKWTPSTNLDCDDCPEPIAHIKKNITYKVDVKSIYGCEASDTIAIKVFCENTQVFIPNAFTPDGDGVNDILMVRGTGIVMVKSFRIFNRWGVIVFERSNFSPNEPSFGWDGKINGKVSPSEVFVYAAEVMCENGIIFTYKGNVSILK